VWCGEIVNLWVVRTRFELSLEVEILVRGMEGLNVRRKVGH
jgi:hypothetical protein